MSLASSRAEMMRMLMPRSLLRPLDEVAAVGRLADGAGGDGDDLLAVSGVGFLLESPQRPPAPGSIASRDSRRDGNDIRPRPTISLTRQRVVRAPSTPTCATIIWRQLVPTSIAASRKSGRGGSGDVLERRVTAGLVAVSPIVWFQNRMPGRYFEGVR